MDRNLAPGSPTPRSVANQFAFIQKMWVNNAEFVRPGTGTDPVIGQGPASTQNLPRAWGSAATAGFDFGGFVTLKGGEFFFAPSIPFLRVRAPPP